VNEWQPIETVPMNGTPVLLYLSADYQRSRQHTGRFLPNVPCGVIGGLFGYDLPGEPTHWMPLPDPPVTQDTIG
jgi:hypothetical protein